MEEANTLDGNGSEPRYDGFMPPEIAAELRAQGVEIAAHLVAPDASAQTGDGPGSPGGDVGAPASPQCLPGQTREGLEKPERTGNYRHENPRNEPAAGPSAQPEPLGTAEAALARVTDLTQRGDYAGVRRFFQEHGEELPSLLTPRRTRQDQQRGGLGAHVLADGWRSALAAAGVTERSARGEVNALPARSWPPQRATAAARAAHWRTARPLVVGPDAWSRGRPRRMPGPLSASPLR